MNKKYQILAWWKKIGFSEFPLPTSSPKSQKSIEIFNIYTNEMQKRLIEIFKINQPEFVFNMWNREQFQLTCWGKRND